MLAIMCARLVIDADYLQAAAYAIRLRILIDRARTRNAAKRGGKRRVDLDSHSGHALLRWLRKCRFWHFLTLIVLPSSSVMGPLTLSHPTVSLRILGS